VKSLLGRLFGKPSGAAAARPGVALHGPQDVPRVMVFTEHFNATYFISFDIPLRDLHAQGRIGFEAYSQQDVEAGGPGCWTAWLDEFKPQAVFLTRYGRADGTAIISDCKVRGIPVVYHIDDNLLDLPPSLGEEIVKRQGAAAQARRAMLQECSLIYASTAVLAQVLRGYFPGKPLVQGIYASYQPAGSPRAAPVETIGYMGSKGHREDLDMIVPALLRLMRERPQLRFETFGTIEPPAALREFEGRVRHHSVQKAYREFLGTLAGLGWSIGLAPLVDEPFNRCKAPTKFIEYTSCGIATAASDVVVYAQAMPPGAGVLARDDWHPALSLMLDEPAQRAAMLQRAQAHCAEVFSPRVLQEQLLEVTARAMRDAV
jgi:hypothetical protein